MANENEKEVLRLPATTNFSSFSELQGILKEEKFIFESVFNISFSSFNDSFVEEIRQRFVGKNSLLQGLLKSIKSIPNEHRKEAGAAINDLKVFIETQMDSFLQKYQENKENELLENETFDVSLPFPQVSVGRRHPVPLTQKSIIQSLRKLGFTVIDGPEIEKDFYNFEALNQPAGHPARSMSDTFFFNTEWLLRSHTSNVQIHALLERELPLRIVCPGFVYRKDYDVTHLPAFRQIECLVVDKGIHFGHLRYVIDTFFKEYFGRPVNTRFRSSYFPFTEPSAELDIECQRCFGKGCRSCKGTGWMELGGCGVVNRNVLRACHIDPEVYSGIAFGFGLDRLAMSRYGVGDLRSMVEGDMEFLKSL